MRTTISVEEVETTEMNKDVDDFNEVTTPHVIDYQEKLPDVQIDDDELNGNVLPKDSDLRAKYIKLVEHNSKLVDLLRTTMQIQTDIFRKLIHYVFP